MAYVSTAAHEFAVPGAAPIAKRSLFRRILDAIEQAQMRRAQREVAFYLRSGTFTDEARREIELRFQPNGTRR